MRRDKIGWSGHGCGSCCRVNNIVDLESQETRVHNQKRTGELFRAGSEDLDDQ
jgi:hypothetical protein